MTNEHISLFDIGELWNCEHAFRNRCPKEWASLDSTQTNGVRYCRECEQEVTLCSTPEEFVSLGNAGKCVAVPDVNTPSSLQSMMMGRPSPELVRALRERQRKTEEWWSAAIERQPLFANDAFSAIQEAIRARNTPPRPLSPEYRQYLTEWGNAVREGPEALYLFMRVRRSGKRESQQSLFKSITFHFPMTFREFKELARRLDEAHPL